MKRKEFQAKLEAVGGDYEKFRANLLREMGSEESLQAMAKTFKYDNAVEILRGAFLWDGTPEGHDYWKDIREKLEFMK